VAAIPSLYRSMGTALLHLARIVRIVACGVMIPSLNTSLGLDTFGFPVPRVLLQDVSLGKMSPMGDTHAGCAALGANTKTLEWAVGLIIRLSA